MPQVTIQDGPFAGKIYDVKDIILAAGKLCIFQERPFFKCMYNIISKEGAHVAKLEKYLKSS
jgi:hypothetical protein